jgi:serine/threonine-protein kinase
MMKRAMTTRIVAVEGEARKLDRFELIAELAVGGMASVYLARLSGVGGFQRFVAIKRLHPHLAREPEFIEMFIAEARLAARIHHPNVVPILEIGQTEQGYYIVMEYVEGDTLATLLARAAQTSVLMPRKVGFRVLVDMLVGLHAAHELQDDDGKPFGIVHRDISPHNVLVGVDGTSRLSDFGVARATSKLSTTRTGQIKGKLAYMSPEQAMGDQDIDRRADIFAAGIVLWEVVTGRRLFKGEGDADTLLRVLSSPIESVRSVSPDAPAAIEAVVTKALERNRDARYSTAAELAEALEQAARASGELGTHKDVAGYLEGVLGSEIAEQRDVIRAWQARSDPSGRGPAALVSATRVVERRDDVTASGVSPVSASLLQAAGRSTAADGLTSEQTKSRSIEVPSPSVQSQRGRFWIPAAVAGIAGVGLFLAYSRGPSSVPAPAPTMTTSAVAIAATSAVASATASAPPSASGGLPSTSGEPPASSSTVAAPIKPTPTHVDRPGAHSPPRVPPSTTAAASAAPPPATSAPPPAKLPDDISRNPYR